MEPLLSRRFEGKVALVTGGGGSLGRAAALRFAQEGADVAVVDIDKAAAESAAEEIEALGRRAIAVEADVSTPEGNENMVAETVARLGKLDIAFNNAGVGGDGTYMKDLSVDAWDRLMAVNLRGIFLGCKYEIPALIEAKGGAIVNMGSSTGGWDTLFGSGPYMASKEGVKGITKNLALEVGAYGIRVNAICPGIIQTSLSFAQAETDPEKWEAFFDKFARRIPLRRVGQPEDVAATVAFLASDDARHITGSMLLIDGGQTLQSWSNAPDTDAYPWYQASEDRTF